MRQKQVVSAAMNHSRTETRCATGAQVSTGTEGMWHNSALSRRRFWGIMPMRLSILIGFMLLLVALPLPLVSQHDMANMPGMSNMHDMSQMGDMAAPQELSPAMAAKLEADKRFSEFNH